MTVKQKRHIWEMLPLLCIMLALIVYMCYTAVDYGKRVENMGTIRDGWQLNGQAIAELPERVYVDDGRARLAVQLGDAFKDAQTLIFYTQWESVSVELDGHEIYSLEKPPRDVLTKAVPNNWNTLQLSAEDAGKQLSVALETPYQQFGTAIPVFYYGTSRQANQFVMMKTVPRFVGALAILFFGLIFAIVALILRFHVEGNSGLYSFSLFVVVLAIFLASQQTTILVAFINSNYLLIQCISYALCPVMYTRYIMRTNKGMEKKVAIGLNILSIGNLIVISALQLMQVCDMIEVMDFTRNLCIIVAVYTLVLELRRHRRIQVGFFSLVVIYSIFDYYRSGNVSWVAYAGVFVYLYTMVYRVLSGVLRNKAQQIRLEAALQVSKSEIATIQITSHFFYHTLDSIRALIRLDGDRAYKMTSDFAKYVRYRVDGVEGMRETLPFSREMRSIRAYTDIKKAQLGERFDMRFEVETEEFEILPLTVQPLVENAVIHAVQRRREGGQVILRCRETEKSYAIEVIDNGPGPNAEEEIRRDEQKRSTAIHNVNTRLAYYGIAPVHLTANDLGGMTASLAIPKEIVRKEAKA